jgi:hypothetical protein
MQIVESAHMITIVDTLAGKAESSDAAVPIKIRQRVDFILKGYTRNPMLAFLRDDEDTTLPGLTIGLRRHRLRPLFSILSTLSVTRCPVAESTPSPPFTICQASSIPS